MRRITLLLIATIMAMGNAWAQERAISGRVTDEKGAAIAGASVSVKGTNQGTITDTEGRFALNVPANAKTIVFSIVGFTTQELPVGNGSLNPILKVDEKALQEVVVTGYTREKKATFAGAAAVISGKVVENVPVGAFDQALQGRAAGVQVNSGSGQPGSSASVTIRGISSIQGANAQPLYIIDGVPMPAFDMQSINANDFESITVLKDANAAALYGARGGLGVIVITTKKGKTGQTNFTLRTNVGITQAPNATNFDMMNTQEIFQYEERMGLRFAALGATPASNPVTGPGFIYSRNNPNYALQTPATQARWDFLRDSLGSIDSDWGRTLFRQGFSKNIELNLSGGSEKTRYFMSMAYFDQQGTDLRSRLQRYTGRFNIDHTIGKLSVQWNNMIGYGMTDLNEGEWRGNSALNPFQMAWRAKNYENPFRQDGTIIFGAHTPLVPRQIGNVLSSIENSLWTDRQLKINTGLTLAYKILPVLTARNVFGIDAAFDRGMRGILANSYIGSLQTLNNGLLGNASRTRAQLVNTSSLIYNQRFNNIHDVEVGGYFEAVRAWNDGHGSQLFNLDPRLGFTAQNAGAQPAGLPYANSASSGFGIRSFFATGRYTYNDKYTINGNIRRDGTSRILNPENREITTWSAGFVWNTIKEGFMDGQNIFSDLKLRASYGSVPNIGSITSNSFSTSGFGLYTIPNYLGPQLPSYGPSAVFGNAQSISGLVPTTPGNGDYRIEYIEKANIGVDIGMWRNRARLTVDAYRNLTKDLFVNQPTPFPGGFNNAVIPINAGTMENKGLEFTLGLDLIKSRNSSLIFSWNHSINKNEILDLGVVNEYVVGTFIIREGLPYGSHYTYDYLGADPQTGRPTYRKLDGGTTNSLGDAGRFADFGTFLPVHVGGLNLDYTYKRFNIALQFSYQTKVSRYNNIWNWVTRGTPGFHNAVNASRTLLENQWQKPGDQKFYQSVEFDRDFTSADIQDSKFLRFRNILVSYNVPGFNIGNTRVIKSARFYAQMFNVWVWSPWKGPDPEDNNNISLNEFPNPRNMVIGLDINF